MLEEFVASPSDFEYNKDDKTKSPLGFCHICISYKKQSKETVLFNIFDGSDEKNSLYFQNLERFCIIRPYIGIPKFFGYFFLPEKTIITEHFPNGNLFHFYSELNAKKTKYVTLWNDTMKSKLTFGIACTMMHIQSFGLFHGYLSPLTIYFDDDYNPKVCDFGYFPRCYSNHIDLIPDKMSESPYCCPNLKETHDVSPENDVFSFGVLLLSIVLGNENFVKTGKEMPYYEIPKKTPTLVSSIIKHCLNIDPSKRPSFSQIVHELKTNEEPLFPETNLEEYDVFVENYMNDVQVLTRDEVLIYETGTKDEKQNP